MTGSSSDAAPPRLPGGEAHAGGDPASSVVAFPRSRGPGQPPDNLPLELTSFVGREEEVSEVKKLLADVRLLILTGPGGSGKTRLVLRVAKDLAEGFADGVWLVELASLSDPDLVPQAVAQALGVREAPGRPLTQTLIEALRPRRLLLVLDNCEHLVEGCAELADALLRSCSGLRILATSREALGIAGENVRPVPPLFVPDPEDLPPVDELARWEAVRLFVERARAVAPAFELGEHNAPAAVRVCQRLDGLPLAIELAAARARVLTVEQIAGRLEDSFGLLTGGSRTAMPRQQTLRAAIGWSHELLGKEEKVLFRRLSVFAGGFTLAAAEGVCSGHSIERDEVLDLLSLLVDKSLVLVAEQQGGDEARYRLLETVRQYGLERLEESGEAEQVRERHAGHYLRLAEAAELELREQGAWLERLGSEHANFRAALSWALAPEHAEEPAGERTELGLRLAAALAQGRFWNAYGMGEGRRWLERGLASNSASLTPVRAKALNQAGFIAHWQGDYQQGGALLEESISLFKEFGDKPGVATSLFHLGHMALHGGDLQRVSALRREAEALKSELSDRQATGFLLIFLGMAARDEGDDDRAVALLEESLTLNREIGDMLGMAMCLTVLGIIALERREPERAAALYEEDLRVLRRLRDKTGTSYGLRGLAGVASLRGNAARAARLWGADEALREAIGLHLSPFDRSHPDHEGLLSTARSRLNDEAAWEAAWSEGRAMTEEQAVEYALGEAQEPAAPVTTPLVPKRTPPASGEEPSEMAPAGANATPELLRIFALGSSRVEKGGQALTSSEWGHAKPKELLFYLLCNPEGRTKEQVGVALWPEASTAQLRGSFHAALHRLRRALGNSEWVVFEGGRYAFNRSLFYSFDAEDFEEKLARARRVGAQGDPGRAIACFEEALDLYLGDFLEDLAVEGEWAMERQEELRRLYLEGLLELGRLYLAEGRVAEAAEANRRALAHDDYLEEAHRGLIRALAASGEKGQALKHYQGLVEMLDEELGAAPAPETRELFESLRFGEDAR